MPYTIRKVGSKWCAFAKDTGEKKGCSDTEAMAKAHLRALYAAENKEMDTKEIDEQVEKCMTEAYGQWVPWSIITFKDYEAWEKQQEMANEVREDTALFKSMVDNIMSSFDITDKAGAINALTAEFANRVKNPEPENKEITAETTPVTDGDGNGGFMHRVKGAVTKIFGIKPKEEPLSLKERGAVMVWKDESDGQYHWLATYSNKYRDRDNPPEILSSGAHQRFADKIDKGLAPLPKLWLWHRKEYEWGEATGVFYDDLGFAHATGIVYPGFEPIAEALAAQPADSIRVSHGMPRETIVYDPTDPSVIVDYETREISPLPAWAAANELTGFLIIEEGDMPVPKEKRQWIIDNLGIAPELLDKLETSNQKAAQIADEKGLESKEVTDEVTTETATEAAVDTPVVDIPQAETEIETSQEETPPTRKEIAEAVASVLLPLREQVDTLTAENVSLKEKLAKLETGVATANKSEDERIAEQLRVTPAASLKELVYRSVIGMPEARVDGRETLAKSKPAEAAPEPAQPGDFVTGIVAGIIKEHTHEAPAS